MRYNREKMIPIATFRSVKIGSKGFDTIRSDPRRGANSENGRRMRYSPNMGTIMRNARNRGSACRTGFSRTRSIDRMANGDMKKKSRTTSL